MHCVLQNYEKLNTPMQKHANECHLHHRSPRLTAAIPAVKMEYKSMRRR
jgi:hypothetical protein